MRGAPQHRRHWRAAPSGARQPILPLLPQRAPPSPAGGPAPLGCLHPRVCAGDRGREKIHAQQCWYRAPPRTWDVRCYFKVSHELLWREGDGAKFHFRKGLVLPERVTSVVALNHGKYESFIHVGPRIQNMNSYVDVSKTAYITKFIFSSCRPVQLKCILKTMQFPGTW